MLQLVLVSISMLQFSLIIIGSILVLLNSCNQFHLAVVIVNFSI